MRKSMIIIVIIMLMLIFAIQSCQAGNPKQDAAKPKVKPLVTFVELGSVNCIPCKMMKPVMADVEKEYGDKISVVFYDVNKDRQKASDYKIRVIPTQVFLDKNGKEFHRHEGFYPKEEIIKLVDKKLGIKRQNSQQNKAENQTDK